jgi:penicillin-binding protein 2
VSETPQRLGPVLDPGPRGRVGPRLAVFAIVTVLAVTGLGLRLFQLQVVEAPYYAALAAGQRVTTRAVPVTRGLMYDRRGRLLVENVPTFTVRVRPAELPFDQRHEVAARLAELLDMPDHRIIERLDAHRGSQYELVRIAGDVPTKTARVIAEEHVLLPGVHVDVEARRHYLHGPLLSHILGWTGRVSASEYARLRDSGYLIDDVVGKAGLEATFEKELRGRYGRQEVQRDLAGRVVQTLDTVEDPVPGHSLQLTIDVGIQRTAEKALRWAMNIIGLKRGVVIVMNPQTGEVLALVSLPAYDNNLFARGISAREYRRLVRDPRRPLMNFAISEQYAPGSTYKLVTAAGALQDRKITPTTKIRTAPYITIGNWKYWDWNKAGFGHINVVHGYARSSDTFFYQVAGMLGIDRLAYWGRQFGFGERTGIDLPGEVAGTVPDDAWKRRVLNQPFFPGEVYHAGIGQGYVAVTPMQLINAFAALANGGTLYRPQLVRKVLDADGNVVRDFKPEVIRRLAVDKSVLRLMRVASRQVLVSRHTWNIVDLPIVIAAKTGTAEFGLRDKQGRLPYHSWFAGFIPKKPRKSPGDPNGFNAVRREDSELAILAFAYDSRTRGNAATEIVKYFTQLHYGLKVDLRDRWLLQRVNFYGSGN